MDPDGAHIILMHQDRIKEFPNQKDGASAQKIFQALRPDGGTPTAEALNVVFSRFRKSAAKGDLVPSFILVFTDGIPNNKQAVETEIINQTAFMSTHGIADNMCTVLFIQVGDDEAAAQELKRLDEALKPRCSGYDIVDTKNVKDLGSKPIVTVVLEAIDG